MISELLPDQPALDNPGVLQAKNVIPYANAYRPVRDLIGNTDPLLGPCCGAAILQNTSANVFNYAADATDIYIRSGDSYNSIQTGYSLNANERWEFARFFDTVIAVNGTNKVLTGDFAQPLSEVGTAPQARYLTIVKNHVVVGNIITGEPNTGGSDTAGVYWSGLGDPTDWTVPSTTGAGFQHLDEAGSVTKVVGGEYLTVFTEAGIYRGNYIGGDVTFAF